MRGPSFEQTGIPLTQVPKLVEIGLVILERKKMWKVHDDNNDDDKQRGNCDQESNSKSLDTISLQETSRSSVWFFIYIDYDI